MAAVLAADGVARAMGDRPFVRDVRTRREREIDFRAEAKEEVGAARWRRMDRAQRDRAIGRIKATWAEQNVGTVKGDVTYDEWLRQQSATFQDEVLGQRKGAAFRKGLVLDQYVDQRGRELTLEQLKAKFPQFVTVLGGE